MAATRGQRSRFTVVVLAMVCLTLITVDTKANHGGVLASIRRHGRDVLVPAQDAVGKVATPAADFVDSLVNSSDLKDENRALRAENAQLRGQVLEAADAVRQRNALLDLDKLDVVKDIPRVAARVVTTAPSNLQLTVELDRGTAAGVAVGMPVTTGAGLVGKVVSTSARRSVVRLISDPATSVAVRTASGAQRAAKGQGAEADLAVDLVRPDEAVTSGEVLVTSGLGGGYPPGIPVAQVTKAVAMPGVAYQDVTAKPVTDLSRLEFVNVLLWMGP
jgi:rod shape-determining protein MreC